MKEIRLYYSLPDVYPAFRVDLSELFAKYLMEKGVNTTWFMERKDHCTFPKYVDYQGSMCLLPSKLAGKSRFIRLVNKVLLWTTDIAGILVATMQSYHILQVRDKYIVSLFGILAAKISGKKFVYWCSYPFPEHYLELADLSKGLKSIYYRLHGITAKFVLYHIIMPSADWVFVQSDFMKKEISKFGVTAEKMTAIPMGVPERLLTWQDKNTKPIHAQQVVYIGIMTPERHLEMLISAFAIVKQHCPDASLLMVGDGVYPHERYALEQQVERLGIEQSVKFTGFVPLEQAWSYAASGAVCVSPIFPSQVLNCGSPTKLYEYMALGRPVVCNQHPDQSMVIEESGAGICVEWDSIKFAEAIIHMLKNPSQAEQMAAKGPGWIESNRHYLELSELVLERYRKLVES